MEKSEETYIKDMVEIIFDLIKDKIKATIEFTLETRIPTGMVSIFKALEEFKF